MTIKSALSVIALATGLVAGPALAQSTALPTMIGSISVPEAEAGAVKARCDELKLAAETQSLAETSDNETVADENQTTAVGDATIVNVPAVDGATAVTVDLSLVTLQDCEADGWFASM